MKELTLQQYTALPDDEKGKYREKYPNPYDPTKEPVSHRWFNEEKQLFRLIEQPVEEKEPDNRRVWVIIWHESPDTKSIVQGVFDSLEKAEAEFKSLYRCYDFYEIIESEVF